MPDYTYTGHNSNLTDLSRQLRKNMTRHERHLWYDFLRGYPVKFYRQRVIGDYIVDFYCSKARLVVELDGSQHYTPEQKAYDNARTDALSGYGVSVIRFSNYDIDRYFEGVCQTIDTTVARRIEEGCGKEPCEKDITE